jgi:hypothetical protein
VIKKKKEDVPEYPERPSDREEENSAVPQPAGWGD